MGAIKAGDVRQVTIGGREFDPKGGDGKITIDVGGYVNKAEPTGNGNMALTQNRKLAGFKDLGIYLDDQKKDLEYLQDLVNKGSVVPVNITVVSGVVYSGQLALVGDLAKDYSAGTTDIEMRGAKFEQI